MMMLLKSLEVLNVNTLERQLPCLSLKLISGINMNTLISKSKHVSKIPRIKQLLGTMENSAVAESLGMSMYSLRSLCKRFEINIPSDTHRPKGRTFNKLLSNRDPMIIRVNQLLMSKSLSIPCNQNEHESIDLYTVSRGTAEELAHD